MLVEETSCPRSVCPYVLAYWKTVRASIDYHVEVDRHYYSVPYQLAGQKLEAVTVEIFHRGKRVASHLRSSINGGAIIDHEAPGERRFVEVGK